MEIRALVFDLAGVLLDFGGPQSVSAISNGHIDEKAFFRFWSEAECAQDLHCGRCSPEEFARNAVREWKLNVTVDAFLANYKTWLRGPFAGAFELLEGLRPRYRLACLSNTNVLDVKRFDDELQLRRRVDECFYSNELGMRKPDPAIYWHVSRTLECQMHEIAFFDDGQKNVEAARSLGMRAHHVTGFGDLTGLLSRMGVLDSGSRRQSTARD